MAGDPSQIGRYRVDGVLGRGAMGVIYRAHDPDIDRVVAIKLIQADLLDGAERAGYVARFRREAQAAGRCMHPNIVTIHDFAMHEGNPFLAMEFVDGVTLAQSLQHTPRFDPADAVFVVLQVLAALGAAHAMGIVHRDIKPANIMLVRGSHVKVADFGISRLETVAATQEGAIVGTPSYMSPEQARGEPVDLRSDLFSTGVLLFELLSGAKPFPGSSFAAVWNALLCPDPVDLSAIPPALQPVLARSLAKPAEARFGSADAMAAALRQAAAAGDTNLSDRTIVMPPQRPPDPGIPTGTSSFDPETLQTLERKLAEYVGPIARRLMQSAVRRGGTMDALCSSLAANIEQPADRVAFERAARSHLDRLGTLVTSSTPAAAGTAKAHHALQLPAAELARIQAALTLHVGPVARVLVKRGLASASSADALWLGLAQHIENPGDRAAFLKQQSPR